MTIKNCAIDQNKKHCPCTFSCGKKGICCECVDYHRANGELPGCYFPKDAERSGNRSIANFITVVEEKGTGFLG